jgi:UDP-N-acetyl-2-amino-2-deoxyglucuronate dehydrogenase
MLGFGIVGCGGAALDVARAIDAVKRARVVAAHDRVRDHAMDLAASRDASVHEDLEGLLQNPSVDIVYIALPHDLLAPIALRALESGHHVLVEKPMALRVEDIASIDDAARAHERAAGVVFELREVAAIRAARDLVRNGAIGDVRQVRIRTVIDKPATYWQSGWSGRVVDDWRGRRDRAGGGVLLMNAIHQVDLVRWITGSSFTRALGDVAEPSPGVEVEDRGGALLRLDGGAQAVVVAHAASPGASHQERIEIDGTLGRLDLPDPYTSGPLSAYLRRPWDGYAQDRWHEIASTRVDPYVAYLDAFTSAIERASAAPVGPGDAGAALATILAIYESSATGQAVEIDPGHAR